jgi:hypothetical protein
MGGRRIETHATLTRTQRTTTEEERGPISHKHVLLCVSRGTMCWCAQVSSLPMECPLFVFYALELPSPSPASPPPSPPSQALLTLTRQRRQPHTTWPRDITTDDVGLTGVLTLHRL